MARVFGSAAQHWVPCRVQTPQRLGKMIGGGVNTSGGVVLESIDCFEELRDVVEKAKQSNYD